MIALSLISVNSQKFVARIMTGNREITLLFCGNLKNDKIRTAYSFVRWNLFWKTQNLSTEKRKLAAHSTISVEILPYTAKILDISW